MGKTQAEYQREYRERKKLTQETNAPNTNAPESNAPESNAPDEPLCDLCGRPTGHPLVVRCGPCCWGRIGKENK